MNERRRLLRENAALKRKLDAALRREGRWKSQCSEQSSARKAAQADRDAALKRLRDQAPGVARLIATVQKQGAVIDSYQEGQ